MESQSGAVEVVVGESGTGIASPLALVGGSSQGIGGDVALKSGGGVSHPDPGLWGSIFQEFKRLNIKQ